MNRYSKEETASYLSVKKEVTLSLETINVKIVENEPSESKEETEISGANKTKETTDPTSVPTEPTEVIINENYMGPKKRRHRKEGGGHSSWRVVGVKSSKIESK